MNFECRYIPVIQLELGKSMRNFDPDIKDLIKSIHKNGIITPLIVKLNRDSGKYTILDGSRRYIAAKELGIDEVLVIEVK